MKIELGVVLLVGLNLLAVGESARTRGIFRNYAAQEKNSQPLSHEDVGTPLFLTPYLEKGNYEEAQNLSHVVLPDDDENVTSYSGYFTVNKTLDSNTFFWYFPAKKSPDTAPLVIWLQGGPGGSSLFGLFFENGPFSVNSDMKLVKRNTSWATDHHVLYFDNPVGTGFSFTGSDEGYCRDETCVGEILYNALQQFLTMFPDLRSHRLFVTGESYAGKYIPALSYAIHIKNPAAEAKINLAGMAIGDGLTDPATMLDYGNMLYGYGLLGDQVRDEFLKRQAECSALIEEEKWMDAFKIWDALLNGDETPYPSLFANASGLTNYYNFIANGPPEGQHNGFEYVVQSTIRKAIHVGNLTFNDGSVVEKHLMEDMIQSVKPWVEVLLESGLYEVTFYSGQVDIIVGYPLTRSFLASLQWSGAEKFAVAPKHIWKVDGDVAGYAQASSGLTLVMVRSAGHLVPHDQPTWALDLIRRVTSKRSFSEM